MAPARVKPENGTSKTNQNGSSQPLPTPAAKSNNSLPQSQTAVSAVTNFNDDISVTNFLEYLKQI